ncbi:MAG: alpha/beta hydrolase [Planctomycetota bacterium]
MLRPTFFGSCHVSKVIYCLVFATALGSPGSRCLAQQPEDNKSQQELWFGVLEAGPRHFRFLVTLDQNDGQWSGNLKSFDEGNAEFALDELKRDDEGLEFLIRVSKGRYVGKLAENKTSIEGKWLQGPADLTLNFEKVEQEPKQKLKALWKGTINIVVQKLDVQIRELESGAAYFDSISQRVGGFVAEKSEEDGKIIFDVAALNGKFTGELSKDGNTLDGTWKQGFVSPSLVLEKVDIAEAEVEAGPNRPQTPKEPFPYSMEDVTFENASAGILLAGTLTVPLSYSNTCPAVILVSGSGPQDRDESLAGHKPFWVIADYFSRRGIAVLRFDDRGIGESKGDFDTATSEDFATDVQAAVEFLQTKTPIDPKRIGICGHSEGGLIAPMVAAKNADVGFIVLMAGPGVNGEKILKSQSALILEASGADAETLQAQSAVQAKFLELALQEPSISEEDFIAQAKKAIAVATPEEEEITDEQLTTAATGAARQLLTPWMQNFIRYEPSTNLEKVACPVLALVGEKDLQVAADLNIPALEKSLKAAPTENFQVLEIPNLNHLFQNCEKGTLEEYSEIEETFDPATLKLMADWILENS